MFRYLQNHKSMIQCSYIKHKRSKKFIMSEKFKNDEIKKAPRSFTKRALAFGATAAILAGTLSGCGEESRSMDASPTPDVIPEETTESVEPTSSPADKEFGLPKIESTYEYEPVYTDAVINYELIDRWEELSGREKMTEAFNFFSGNGIPPVSDESYSPQALIDNLQERADLCVEIMNDVSDPRNSIFGEMMLESGVYYSEKHDWPNDGNTNDYDDFIKQDNIHKTTAGRENWPFEYTFGKASSYSDQYNLRGSSIDQWSNLPAVWIRAEGRVNYGPAVEDSSWATLEFVLALPSYQQEDEESGRSWHGFYPVMAAVSSGGLIDPQNRPESEVIIKDIK